MKSHLLPISLFVLVSSFSIGQETGLPPTPAPPTSTLSLTPAPTTSTEPAASEITARQRAMVSQFRGRDANTLDRMKQDMTAQLREITRVISQIDPRDTRFAESLKSEQNDLIEQIKAIDAQVKNSAKDALGDPGELTESALSRTETTPPVLGTATTTPRIPDRRLENPANRVPFDTGNDFLKQQSIETIKRLRQLGLHDLADQEQKRFDDIPKQMMPPEATLPPMRQSFPREETPSIGFPQVTPRTPWAPQSGGDVAELKATITALQTEIEQMRQDMKAIETQLRLLNQNILLKNDNKN